MAKSCKHCGVELPPPHPGKGRQRMFCSDTCRVKFAYRGKLGFTTNRERLHRMRKEPYVAPQLDTGTAMWMAAMIDGEGHICLHRHDRTRRQNTTHYYFPVVGVSNSNTALIARVREIVGVSLTNERLKKGTEKQKIVYTATISRIAIADVLRQVRPHLIAKQRQADIVTEFCGIHDQLPVRTSPLDRFEGMFLEMQRLNKRGV